MGAAQTIRNIRRSMYMTQKKFAKAINVSPMTVSYYETGKRNPALHIIKKIVDLAKKHDITLCMNDFLN